MFEQLRQQEVLKSRHRNELLEANIYAQEKERKRIAADLHDELGAALSLSHMQLAQLEDNGIVAPPSAIETLKQLRYSNENALINLRRICAELMPVHLELFGLTESLLQFIKPINNLNIVISPLPQLDLDEFKVINLYRIITELINNTVKHAAATTIEISFAIEQASLIVKFRDNGKGFVADDKKEKTGLGLRNIQSRTAAMNGHCDYISENGYGLSMILKIPLNTI